MKLSQPVEEHHHHHDVTTVTGFFHHDDYPSADAINSGGSLNDSACKPDPQAPVSRTAAAAAAAAKHSLVMLSSLAEFEAHRDTVVDSSRLQAPPATSSSITGSGSGHHDGGYGICPMHSLDPMPGGKDWLPGGDSGVRDLRSRSFREDWLVASAAASATMGATLAGGSAGGSRQRTGLTASLSELSDRRDGRRRSMDSDGRGPGSFHPIRSPFQPEEQFQVQATREEQQRCRALLQKLSRSPLSGNATSSGNASGSHHGSPPHQKQEDGSGFASHWHRDALADTSSNQRRAYGASGRRLAGSASQSQSLAGAAADSLTSCAAADEFESLPPLMSFEAFDSFDSFDSHRKLDSHLSTKFDAASDGHPNDDNGCADGDHDSDHDGDGDGDGYGDGSNDHDGPVGVADDYSDDEFRMYEFKVRRCTRGRSHDWTECPFAHPGEKAKRRDPRKYRYSGTACPDYRKGSCRRGDACEFAHGVFEAWLHPDRYGSAIQSSHLIRPTLSD